MVWENRTHEEGIYDIHHNKYILNSLNTFIYDVQGLAEINLKSILLCSLVYFLTRISMHIADHHQS